MQRKGYWVVGSKSQDSQIIIAAEKIEQFKKLFEAIDGMHTINDLSEMGFGDPRDCQ